MYMNSDNGFIVVAGYCCCTRAVNATLVVNKWAQVAGVKGTASAIVHRGTSQDTHNANELQAAEDRQESESQRQRLRLSMEYTAGTSGVEGVLDIWRWPTVLREAVGRSPASP
jgi:hypothetical protein